jgi:hypothetical protein
MTFDDCPLFNYAVAAHNGTDTSRDAAVAIQPDLGRLQRLVLDAVGVAVDGLTCKQVEDVTGLSHQTASARLNELTHCQPPFLEHRLDDEGKAFRRRSTGPKSSGRIYFKVTKLDP